MLAKETKDFEQFYNYVIRDLKIYYNDDLINKHLISKEINFLDENIIINMEFEERISLNLGDKLVITLYDNEYFCDYDYNENSLKINLTNNLNYVFSENKEKAYYFNMIYPKEIEVFKVEK